MGKILQYRRLTNDCARNFRNMMDDREESWLPRNKKHWRRSLIGMEYWNCCMTSRRNWWNQWNCKYTREWFWRTASCCQRWRYGRRMRSFVCSLCTARQLVLWNLEREGGYMPVHMLPSQCAPYILATMRISLHNCLQWYHDILNVLGKWEWNLNCIGGSGWHSQKSKL